MKYYKNIEPKTIIVTKKEALLEAVQELKAYEALAFDTETTGLFWYERPSAPKDVPFVLSVSSGFCAWVFELTSFTLLSDKILIASIFQNKTLYAQNAKFDIHMLENYFTPFAWIVPKVKDTAVMGRLVNSNRLKYSLDSLSKDYLGAEKSTLVDKEIEEKHLYSNREVEGQRERVKHFDKVDREILYKYAALDASLTYFLAMEFERLLESFMNTPPVKLEESVTPILQRMERTGIKVNVDYIKKSQIDIRETLLKLEERFLIETGLKFVDHRNTFDKIFKGALKTEKGNSSYSDDTLSILKANEKYRPMVELIIEHRELKKKLTTYFDNFLYYRDTEDKIHCDFKQSGAATGRFSATDPALQTLPRDETGSFPIRRAFIPSEDFFFVSIDYKAMEMRLMFELAADFHFKKFGSRGLKIIDEILKGEDMHTVTANMMKVPRQYAKTLGFMLLYGGGANKLAESIGVSFDEAVKLKNKYFEVMPEVKLFIRETIKKCERMGYIQGPFNRVWKFPRDFAYKAPNYLIQGTCSDILRVALVNCQKVLEGARSRLVLTVHDECVFEVHKDEQHLIPALKRAMIDAYNAKFLPMDCDVEYSAVSWFDKEEYDEARISLENSVHAPNSGDSKILVCQS